MQRNSTIHQKVVMMLKRGATLSTPQIAERINKRANDIGGILRRMKNAGVIEICGSCDRGAYVWKLVKEQGE